jgi:hypothetical protein
MALAGSTACGGTMRTPIQHVPPAPIATRDALPIGPPVLSSSPGPRLIASPITPVPQRVSAQAPPRLPSYAGVWSGETIRRACVEFGGAIGVACRAIPEHNWMRLEITQAGSQAQAVLMLGGQRAALAGRVQPDGSLVLRGGGGGAGYVMTVSDWHATVDQGRLDGAFAYVIAAQDERLGSISITAAYVLSPARNDT